MKQFGAANPGRNFQVKIPFADDTLESTGSPRSP